MRGHPLYVYHKNLLDHIGTHSSFAVRPDRLPFPRCFDPMAHVWSIHALERFNVWALDLGLPILCCLFPTSYCLGLRPAAVNVHCKLCPADGIWLWLKPVSVGWCMRGN